VDFKMIATKNKYMMMGVIALGLVCLGGGGFVLVQEYQKSQAEQAALKAIEEERAAAAQEYEDLLNAFIKDMATQAGAYKIQRKVLREIARPYNFEKPEYAKESYEEFMSEIAPGLRRQAIQVMNVFDIFGAKLELASMDKPAEMKDYINQKWQEMKSDTGKNYISYFEKEEVILKAYEELLRFYFVKSKTLKATEAEVTFENPEDKAQEQVLLKKIEELQGSAAAQEEKATVDVGGAPSPSDATAKEAVPAPVPPTPSSEAAAPVSAP
jgi:hypothetical protein